MATRPDVDAMRRRLALTTPGEWALAHQDTRVIYVNHGKIIEKRIAEVLWDAHGLAAPTLVKSYDNAAFLSHAKQDMEALLDYVGALEDEVRALSTRLPDVIPVKRRRTTPAPR
jgi:hypothetical protein